MEWLDNLRSGVRAADEKATNALRYYMGPAYAPVNALANVAAMLSPGEDFIDMHRQGNALMQSRTPTDAGMNALGMGAATMGMFLGPAAKIANKGALELAQKLDLDGADARRIWDETGWFKGADDKWRFEIDDSAARIGRLPTEKQMKRQIPLDRVMPHPEMASAYDDLPAVQGKYGMGDAVGSFDKDANVMNLDMARVVTQRNKPEARATLLHELQHAAQAKEGFASGGSVGSVGAHGLGYTPSLDVLDQADTIAYLGKEWPGGMDEYLKAFPDSLPDGTPYEDAALYFAKNPEKLNRARTVYSVNTDPVRSYQHLAGEVEARNVETRRDWSMDQRRATPPWETEDVPRDQQIVRFR